MPMKTVTLREIAEELNISITTVSKALKGYADVSDSTRERVKHVAEKLNYRPNAFAVNLRTRESKTIGLIIPEVVHHFFSNVVKGIITQAEKKGYLVIILQSNESYKLEKKQIELLLRHNVDGLLISLANGTDDFTHLKEFMRHDKPLVMFDKIAKMVDCTKVVIDDRQAGYDATKYLIDTGCSKIAHFRGPLLPQNSIDRYQGYRNALRDHGMRYDPSLVFLCKEMTYDEGVAHARRLWADRRDVDGIFINTDLVAIGAITELKKMGVDIPEKVAVIGFSNWFMSSAISPSVTTVDQPGYEMGRQAFKLLLKEMKNRKKGKKIDYITKVLDTSLVVRESTKRISDQI